MTQILARFLDEWLAESAKFCNRYHVRMTAANCKKNQGETVDLRCGGCAGLEDVERELERVEPVIFLGLPDPEESLIEEPATEDEDSYLYDPAPAVLSMDLDDLDELGSGLLAFMEDEYEEPEPPRRRKQEKTGLRFAVFMGRCPRCRGYMLNSPERDDHAVHRCFTCGYRTSPGYVWNRNQGV